MGACTALNILGNQVSPIPRRRRFDGNEVIEEHDGQIGLSINTLP
jgi:hypothetical protein